MPWILVFHLLSIVYWMGGLLAATYLLRLQATSRQAGSEDRPGLGLAQLKLMRAVVHPGAAVVVITGVVLIWTNPSYYLHAVWLYGKLLMVAAMIALDLIVNWRIKGFQAGRFVVLPREALILHYAVILMLLQILILVIVKPLDHPLLMAV